MKNSNKKIEQAAGERPEVIQRINMLIALQKRGVFFPLGRSVTGEEIDRLFKETQQSGIKISVVPFKDMSKIEKRSFLESFNRIDPKNFIIKTQPKPGQPDYKEQALRSGFYKTDAGEWRKVNIKSYSNHFAPHGK